jgi:tripartite-type tricarboxylate transporter receptor subunit TctC
MRALGVSSTIPISAMPDLPTIVEAGESGFDAVSWTLICAPVVPENPIRADFA